MKIGSQSNHCGMEMQPLDFERSLWNRLVSIEPLWNGNCQTTIFITVLAMPKRVSIEPLWNGNLSNPLSFPFPPPSISSQSNHSGMEIHFLPTSSGGVSSSLNRTIVEWKSTSPRWISPNSVGLNRTIVEWKLTYLPLSTPPSWRSQSNHSGMEILQSSHKCLIRKVISLNRTIVEWK